MVTQSVLQWWHVSGQILQVCEEECILVCLSCAMLAQYMSQHDCRHASSMVSSSLCFTCMSALSTCASTYSLHDLLPTI